MADPQRRKWRKRRMETPYARITEIREAQTTAEANDCLNNGFVLIKAVEKRSVDALGRQDSCVIYILGKLKDKSPAQPQNQAPSDHDTTSPLAETPTIDPSILEERQWRQYENGSGEWTFITSQDGNMLPELEPASEFIQRLLSGEEIILGNYRYRAKDKFLKRYPASGQRE